MQSTDTGHVSQAEWRWVTIVSVVLVLLAFLPFLWVLAIGLTGSNWQFMGALHDYNNSALHFARIFQGTQDKWLVLFLHTPEPQTGTFIDFIYTLIGQLSRLVSLPPVASFHAARVGASLFMYLAIYQLAASIWVRVRTRRIFFVLAVTGGGLGWFVAPIFDMITVPDVAAPFAFPFFSTLTNVHYPLTIACLAMLASVAILIFRPGITDPPSVENGGVMVFVSGLILMFIYPLAALPVMLTMVFMLMAIRRQQKTSFESKLRWLAWFLIPMLPMLAYYIAIYTYNDIARQVWQQSNAFGAPSLLAFVLGFASLLAIGLPGLYRVLRRFEPDGDQFMFIWLLTMILLIYLPTGVQMSFAAGIVLPMAYFATRSIEDFWFQYIPRRWRLRLMVAVLPLIALTPIFMLMLPVRPMATGDFSEASGIVLERDYFDAFGWLKANSGARDVVLAAPKVSVWLPAWSGARVVYGHPIETVEAEQKEAAVIQWYRETDPAACPGLLEGSYSFEGSYSVRYVLLGPQEQELGTTVCTDLLRPVQRVNSVLIYAYIPASD